MHGLSVRRAGADGSGLISARRFSQRDGRCLFPIVNPRWLDQRHAVRHSARCRSLDLLDLRARRLVGRRGRCAILPLALQSGVVPRRQAILSLTVNGRQLLRRVAVRLGRLILGEDGLQPAQAGHHRA
ncbi:hypothetical protein MPLDJ20_120312 [Mesorhizobium plurifarium]|uniref:Uncharacterized protein n=1 Tax=Mesorhizobium plurifarium TaxID=69974 RepID=A0A090GBU5_MESPL|nr:hypothetical protein MPLDJ20_120312 [Mesorhizobium plurifarium]